MFWLQIGEKMQTINIQTSASSSVLESIKTLLLSIDPLAKITLEEKESEKKVKKDIIKENILKDIELYRQGKLKTIKLDELKEECKKW